MNIPFVTGICVTYGRTKLLQNVLKCFEQQDYKGPHELLILNTFPEQKLSCVLPNVRIINIAVRPTTLGASRNLAVSMAKDGVCCTLDDDDLFLPHHFRMVAESFARTDLEWIRFIPTFYSEGSRILKTFDTWINGVAFTTSAWKKIKGYDFHLSIGEDQQLYGKLSEMCRGTTVQLAPHEISQIYCWGNGALHLSGRGWDKPNQTCGYERARLDLLQRVKNGAEPVGDIVLQPRLTHDPVAMAKDYLPAPGTVTPAKESRLCIVELGRYGDIINILPVARHIAENYQTPHMMVAREFANVLEGVSYVIPHIVDLRNDQLGKAVNLARKEYRHIIVSQIWGTGWKQDRKTDSFNRESWRMAGFLQKFDDHSPLWRPQFDLRNATRERQVVDKVLTLGKPILLVNVTRSTSSPFSQGEALLQAITHRFGQDFTIVDAGSLRVHRIYDMLAIIEESSVVVSIDTALLHLATGTNTAIVALVNDKPWQGSEIRGGHCIDRILYSEATPDRVLAAIIMASQTIPTPVEFRPVALPPTRNIYHVTERHHETDQKTEARKRKAWESWDVLYASRAMIPCHLWEPYPRNAKDTIGDKRALPYLKDVLEHGMQQATDDDIILFTNDDNVLHPQVVDMVRLHCSIWGAVCSQRCEFKEHPIPNNATPEEFATLGRMHMGRDLFAFTRGWLLDHWTKIPDVILGASDWDLMLCAFVRLQWGIETDRPNLEECLWPADMERGYVAHQFHAPLWAAPDNQYNAPSQKHNRTLFKAWASTNLPKLQFLAGDVI